MASIYDYYEKGDIKKKDKDIKGNEIITYYYKCKVCLSKLSKEGLESYKGITANRKTNSNLHTHLGIECALHQKAKSEFEISQVKQMLNTTPQSKRRLAITDENDDPTSCSSMSTKTPIKTLLNMNAIKQTPKYNRTNPMQLSRFRQLVIMLVRCMLPIFLVEKQPFRKFVEILDPSFHMPTRYAVKKSGLPQLREEVKKKLSNILNLIPWPNIILDGWSDGILRCFTGYIVQGIDNNWNLVQYTLAFRLTKGNYFKIFFFKSHL
jgi:hypothetical protein